jgi:hypothetical protein
MGLGGVLVLLVLNSMVYNPYMEKRDALKKAMAASDKAMLDNRGLEDRHARLVGQWDAMLKGGMKTAPAEAQLQFDTAMHDWALHAGLVPGEYKRTDSQQPDKIPGQLSGAPQLYQKSKSHFVATGTYH